MRKSEAIDALAAVTSLRKGVYTVDDVYVLTGHVDRDFAEDVLNALGAALSTTRHTYAVMSGLPRLQYGERGTALALCKRATNGAFPVTVATPLAT